MTDWTALEQRIAAAKAGTWHGPICDAVELEALLAELREARRRLFHAQKDTEAARGDRNRFQQERDAAREALREMEQRKDAAYEERNRLVAALAAVFPSVKTRTAIEGWSDDWHGCVYVALPSGQASWHFHDSQAALFAHVPEGSAAWDGHTTEEKYRRVAALGQPTEPQS